MNNHRKSLTFLILGVFITIFSFTFLTKNFATHEHPVQAATLDNFRPGNIISDYVMSNYNSMSEAEIQSFLKSKNHCNDTNISKATKYPNLHYHIKDGHFVCLADELFGNGTNYGGTTGETAAHIIWQAAQDYHINPQALLVLLQKEQGLITDTWPNHIQYRSATGYGCPDTAACNSEYYGFKNQISKAAQLFRTVLNGGWTNYPLGNNFIQYNPNKACGGSIVNIENLATSSLYRYTPYQPNAGALAAGTGTAYCGAYGNRNFYLYFSNWFGDPTFIHPPKTPSDILEGDYFIIPASHKQSIISLSENSHQNFIKYNLKPRNDNEYEYNIFSIKKTDTQIYQIINKTTNKVIDIPKAEIFSGAVLNQYHINNTNAQKWSFAKNSDGTVSIIPSQNHKLVLDVSGDYLSLAHNYNSIDQKFYLVNVASAKIPPDVYFLSTKKDFHLDIFGGAENAINHHTNIHLWSYNNTNAQKFKLNYDAETGYYEFINPYTTKAIDVENASTIDGSNVNLYKSNHTCAQKWTAMKVNEGYLFYSACSDKFLTYDEDKKRANIFIHQANTGYTNQVWILTQTNTRPLVDGVYNIHSAIDTNLVMDIKGGAEDAQYGTNIHIWQQNYTKAQDFRLTYNPETTAYTIFNDTSKLFTLVDNNGDQDGDNITIGLNHKDCTQQWKIYQIDNKYHELMSLCSRLVLDLSGGQPIKGANINLYHQNGTLAQRWRFVKK